MELKNVSDFIELYFIKAIGKMIWISLFTNIDIYIFQTRNCPYKNSTVNLVLILFSFSSFMDYKKSPAFLFIKWTFFLAVKFVWSRNCQKQQK